MHCIDGSKLSDEVEVYKEDFLTPSLEIKLYYITSEHNVVFRFERQTQNMLSYQFHLTTVLLFAFPHVQIHLVIEK